MKKKKIIGAGAVAVLVLLIVTAACMTGNSDAKEKQAKDRQQSITAEQPKKDKKLPTKLVTTDKKTASKASTEKKESESGQKQTAEQTAEKAAKADTSASQPAAKNTSANTASKSKQQPQASKRSKPSKQSHTHAWQEQTTVVHHPATGHEEQVLVKAAWTEEIPIYETRAWECCNTCGADITANYSQHMKEHALKGENAARHTEYEQVVVGKNVVEHPAEYTTQWVQDSGAWDETVVTGYRCSCGATK